MNFEEVADSIDEEDNQYSDDDKEKSSKYGRP